MQYLGRQVGAKNYHALKLIVCGAHTQYLMRNKTVAQVFTSCRDKFRSREGRKVLVAQWIKSSLRSPSEWGDMYCPTARYFIAQCLPSVQMLDFVDSICPVLVLGLSLRQSAICLRFTFPWARWCIERGFRFSLCRLCVNCRGLKRLWIGILYALQYFRELSQSI